MAELQTDNSVTVCLVKANQLPGHGFGVIAVWVFVLVQTHTTLCGADGHHSTIRRKAHLTHTLHSFRTKCLDLLERLRT